MSNAPLPNAFKADPMSFPLDNVSDWLTPALRK
jgi:hypothetical protein